MYKWIFLALFFLGTALYFTGALDLDMSGEKIDVSIDKEKATELGESLKEKIEQ